MGLLSWITGGSAKATAKTVENVSEMGKTVTNGIVSGIDALFHTEEEKVEDRKDFLRLKQEGLKVIYSFYDRVASENTEQSKARREIANASIKVFFALIFLGLLAKAGQLFSFNAETTQSCKELAAYIHEQIKEIGFLVTGVSFIYFGPHQLTKLKGSRFDPSTWRKRNGERTIDEP